TIVFITHDLDEALKLGDRIAIMNAGEIVQIGAPEEILTNPKNEYVQSFVENVDRSRVITAGTIMRKPDVLYLKYGPHLALRRLRQMGLSTGIVVDSERKFRGYVRIDDLVTQAKRVPADQDSTDRHTLKPVLQEDMPQVDPGAAISELVGTAAERVLPIAVVNAAGRLEGIITRSALLAGLAGD